MADMAFGAWEPAVLADGGRHRRRAAAAAAACRRTGWRSSPRPGRPNRSSGSAIVCASRETPDYHALVVLNMILGGQFVSRVNLNLRQDKGYTYGVRTGFDLRRGLGPFVLQTSVQTEGHVPAHPRVAARDRRTSAAPGRRPPTNSRLAKASITLGYPRGFETAQQVARGVAQLALHGLPDTYFEEFVPRVEAVSLDDVTPRRRSTYRRFAHGHADRRRCRSHRPRAARRSAKPALLQIQ